MTQTFKLETVDRKYDSISPSMGEDLGAFLAKAAEDRERAYRGNIEAKVMYWGRTVAHVYHLAADAYELGASVTIGHNRSDRYMARASELRRKAETIIAQAEAQSEEVESARMMTAFIAGYEGQDLNRFAFEQREAALVGQLFAEQSMPIPQVVRVIRVKPGVHRIMAGDCLYAVDYPNGRIPDAIVSLVDE